MLHYAQTILIHQIEAALSMLKECVRQCPDDRWEDRIAAFTFRQLTYHTLFFADLYLTRNEESFELRALNRRGGDERNPVLCTGLSREESLEYVEICRKKLLDVIPAESEETLAGPSGFSWYPCSRGELHLINLRHIQHHAAQLSAHLRRVEPDCREHTVLPWVRSGWK